MLLLPESCAKLALAFSSVVTRVDRELDATVSTLAVDSRLVILILLDPESAANEADAFSSVVTLIDKEPEADE